MKKQIRGLNNANDHWAFKWGLMETVTVRHVSRPVNLLERIKFYEKSQRWEMWIQNEKTTNKSWRQLIYRTIYRI